ncbi:hypothetical protein TA3x_004896 [Tundrisphaera sp. TA3]|uniref:hypothetical protein n=1 Tax=Tundrisphaera sp. TA3 TaxID=3435775 RepID=UPI003EBF6BB4
MIFGPGLIGLIALAAAAGTAAPPIAGDSALTLADLEGYRRALSEPATGPAAPVAFRDLWDRPGEFVGRRVRIAGRVARIFRQPPVGTFPGLVEAWAVAPTGEPTCLVFPDKGGAPKIQIGESVEFEGTYLKRLRYPGGDADRLAPLLVGPAPPSRANPGTPSGAARPWATADLMVGLGVAAAVALLLARRHLARPARPIRERGTDPEPEFDDGGEPPRLEFVDAPGDQR